MTSISTVTTNQFVFQSPRDRLQNELTTEIAAGTIAATDLDPLSAALDSIDQTLKSQRTSDRAAGTAPPSPDEMKAKIDDLIAAQVSSGKLTSEQADELKNVFANTFSSGPGARVGPVVRVAPAVRAGRKARTTGAQATATLPNHPRSTPTFRSCSPTS